MKSPTGINANLGWQSALLVVLLSIAGLITPTAIAQQATANVTGVVKDQSGAAIANAQVDLTNVSTGVSRISATFSVGFNNFPSVDPGSNNKQVSATGVCAGAQPPV